MALVDDFTNTNGTTLTTHNANWVLTTNSQTDVGNWTIQNNELQAAAFKSLYAYRSDSSSGRFKVTLKGNGTDARYSGPSVRMSAANEGYSAVFSVISGGDYTRVEIRKNGGFYDQHILLVPLSQSVDQDLEISAVQNGANVDLEVFVNSASVWTGTDTTPLTAGNDGIYIGNTNGVVTFDNASNGVISFTFDSLPGDIRASESRQITVSGATSGKTLVDFDLRLDNASGVQATPTSVTEPVAGTYQLTFNFPIETNKKFDRLTGYPLYLVIDGESNTSTAVPYKPQTGWAYVDIGTPNTSTEPYQQYAGGNFVTNDQCVWDTKSNTITIASDTSWNINPPNNVSTDMYRIASDGTKDVDDVIVFTGEISLTGYLSFDNVLTGHLADNLMEIYNDIVGGQTYLVEADPELVRSNNLTGRGYYEMRFSDGYKIQTFTYYDFLLEFVNKVVEGKRLPGSTNKERAMHLARSLPLTFNPNWLLSVELV